MAGRVADSDASGEPGGVLAAIIVPNVTGMVGAGQPEAAKAELQ